MQTAIAQTPKGNFVENIVYCNKKMNIVNFLQFPNPLPQDQVKPEELYKDKFSFGIVQFTNGTSIKYVPAKK